MPPKKPPADIPPTSLASENQQYCTETGCYREAYAQGKCQSHFIAVKKGPRAASIHAGAGSPPVTTIPPVGKKMTRLEVETIIIPTMVLLSVMVDEAYEPGDIIVDKEGNKSVKIKPHVEQAITEMTPWFEIYGASFAKAAPWFGLIAGCTTLAMPAIDPTLEIVAGVRKPRCMRKHPSDVYTEAYTQAMHNRQQKNQDAAANKTVPASVVNEGEFKATGT